jgi:hypothetical protein
VSKRIDLFESIYSNFGERVVEAVHSLTTERRLSRTAECYSSRSTAQRL